MKAVVTTSLPDTAIGSVCTFNEASNPLNEDVQHKLKLECQLKTENEPLPASVKQEQHVGED